MDKNKLHSILKKYKAENQKALKEIKVSMEATVSHFNQAIERMEAANDEFASEISEHIVDLDVRVARLKKLNI